VTLWRHSEEWLQVIPSVLACKLNVRVGSLYLSGKGLSVAGSHCTGCWVALRAGVKVLHFFSRTKRQKIHNVWRYERLCDQPESIQWLIFVITVIIQGVLQTPYGLQDTVIWAAQ
jgi:hypothetical protein